MSKEATKKRAAAMTAAILGVSAGGFNAGAQAADFHKDEALNFYNKKGQYGE